MKAVNTLALKKYDTYLDNFNKAFSETMKPSKIKPDDKLTLLDAHKNNISIAHNNSHPGIQGYYQNFDRFYSIYNDLEMDSLTQYVFIVRPDLNVVDEVNTKFTSPKCNSNAFLNFMCSNHNTVLLALTDRFPNADHDFIPFLVGRTESIQMPDISIKTSSISQPFTNILMPYGSNMWESMTGGTFDITFREDRDLRIHKLFQSWLIYIDGVSRGVFSPKKKYIEYNKYDYMSSVYYFVCQADGESLVWWNKYTGVFPTSVPNSDMSFNLRGSIDSKITIPFTYFMQDTPLNPMILVDFNRNSTGGDYDNPTVPDSYLSAYDENVVGTRNGLFGAPFISNFEMFVRDRKLYTNASIPKLRWRTPKIF